MNDIAATDETVGPNFACESVAPPALPDEGATSTFVSSEATEPEAQTLSVAPVDNEPPPAVPEPSGLFGPLEVAGDRGDSAMDKAAADEAADEAASQTVVLEQTPEGDLAVAEPTLFGNELIYEPAPEEEWAEERAEKWAAVSAGESSDGWSLMLLGLGLLLAGLCIVLPQVDANRQLAYQRDRLQADLEQIQSQVAVNQQFLRGIDGDAQLAERLALRQLKLVPRGQSVLNMPEGNGQSPADPAEQTSPFYIVHVAPPPAPEPYQPVGGVLAAAWLQPQTRLYVLGTALFLVAAGLFLGGSRTGVVEPAPVG